MFHRHFEVRLELYVIVQQVYCCRSPRAKPSQTQLKRMFVLSTIDVQSQSLMRKGTYRLCADKCIVCIELFSFSVFFFRMNFFSLFSKKTQENILLHSPWASLPLCKLESDINGYPTGQMMLLKFLELFFKKEAVQHKHWVLLAK